MTRESSTIRQVLPLPAVAAAMGTGCAASTGAGWEFAAATGGFARLIRP
jgi:hypothetical protein